MKLRWTDNGMAKGDGGTLYSIFSEPKTKLVGERFEVVHVLTIFSGNHWAEVKDSQRQSKREVKALAQKIEDKEHEPCTD